MASLTHRCPEPAISALFLLRGEKERGRDEKRGKIMRAEPCLERSDPETPSPLSARSNIETRRGKRGGRGGGR